ncbi:MAG: hypothetical protein IJU20_06105 [Clostridia bacterium]|nr:hypothetical protein [Clostridia bacterium]
MKKTVKILSLVLAVLLCSSLLLLFSSCGKQDNPPETDGSKAETQAEPLSLTAEDGTVLYQIIRSDFASASVVTASAAIARSLNDLYGHQPVIGTDWIDRNGVADHPETEYEILIGKTNRSQSEALYAEMETQTTASFFVIRVEGKKILIGAVDDVCLVRGIQYFVSEYLSGEKAGIIPENLNERVEVNALYHIHLDSSKAGTYDLSVAAATLQGLYNRESSGSRMYISHKTVPNSSNILKLMRENDGWLSVYNLISVSTLEDWVRLGKEYIKTVIIWDPGLAATLNVATTMAGVEDGIVLTQAQYDALKDVLPEEAQVKSLVGKFDGSETGSAKNDAYRWAIREYLETGKCTFDRICSFEDSFLPRDKNELAYTVTRDLAVYDRAFVFDLSVWSDERPKDDPGQKLGTDFDTYMQILKTVSEKRGMDKLTEIDGFFPSGKYCSEGNTDTFTAKRNGTQTEWEYTYQFTPYGFYWNSVAAYSYNMSLHCQYDVKIDLEQQPVPEVFFDDAPDVLYLLLVVGDYDASGSLYIRMYNNWNNSARGNMPLAWAVNSNLIELYPDLFEYFYSTATPNDFFVSNMGAGWYNPSRVRTDTWETVVAHHKHYFDLTDITIAPDMWDFQTFSALSESYITQYCTDGIGTLISRQNGRGTGAPTVPHVSDSGVPINAICNVFPREDSEECGIKWAEASEKYKRAGHATFMSVRTVWSTPAYLEACVESFRKQMPDTEIVVLDPFNFYAFLKESLTNG